jgi:hypothetical protein
MHPFMHNIYCFIILVFITHYEKLRASIYCFIWAFILL